MAEAKASAKNAPASAGSPTGAPGVEPHGDELLVPAEKVALKPLLKSAWPVPALVIAAGVLGGGLYHAFSQRPRSDPSVPLKQAEQQVESGEFKEAIETLNGPALGFHDSGLATRPQEARFFLARARAFAGAQGKLGISRLENHQQIVSDYRKVEELREGAGGDAAAHGEAESKEALEPSDVSAMVESLIALGSVDEALRRIATLGDGQNAREKEEFRARKLRLTRLLIEHNLAATKPEDRRDDLTLDLLARMSSDAELAQDERGWVLAKQAELLMSLNRVEDAITKLLRELQRMRDVGPAQQGELYVLLGKAYVETGQDANAAKQLDVAERLLAQADSGNPLRADAAVLLGRLAQRAAQGKGSGLDQARERYALVTTEFKGSRAYLPAMLGLAEIDADNREFDTSIDKYEEVAGAILKWKPPAPPIPREAGRPTVTASLMARWQSLFDAGDLDSALRFAQVAEGLYSSVSASEGKPQPVPLDLMLALGRTHRRIADEKMEAARATHAADFTVRDLDPATRAEVKRHYLAAGDLYRRHAERVSGDDTAAFIASQWISADSYDLAGDMEESAKAFSAYVDGAADADPNRPAAKFRLAQIFEAQSDFKAAESLYEDLRTDTGEGKQPKSAGSWSDRSIVPLARCYLADNVPDNDAQAESLLVGVIDGKVLGPEARDYRDALIELGNMYYSVGRYPDAIARLEEVVNRYGPASGPEQAAPAPDKDADAPVVGAVPGAPMPSLPLAKLGAIRFKLADSHRLEAGNIARTLLTALPQTIENELRASRLDHLRTAMRHYEQVRSTLEMMDAARMTELEKTFLRNSFFYIGDCAFDMGDYSKAVAAYDAAALRYVDDPASLVAMVQIVNAYVAQGQNAQARTANERARRQLARFPDEVWNRADLPMEKKHWEKWLESRQMLEASAAAGVN